MRIEENGNNFLEVKYFWVIKIIVGDEMVRVFRGNR